MRLKMISCQVFCREVAAVAARSASQVEIEFLSKGLHNIGCIRMRERIQAAIDGTAPGYDAILLGYGLCNNGLVGLKARGVPLVVPRSHDCIGILLGSTPRFLDYFERNPATYFRSSGWIEHVKNPDELDQISIARRHSMDATFEELVARYGEENARFLARELLEHTRHYSQFTFIEMGVEPDDRFERMTREDAERRGWRFEKIQGDISLLQRMVDGEWAEREFLIVRPGQKIAAAFDNSIIAAQSS